MATALKTNVTLSSLYIVDNSITDVGGLALRTMMSVNTTLCTVAVGQNYIQETHCQAIRDAAHRNKLRRDSQFWSTQHHVGFHVDCHRRFITILLATQRSTLPFLPTELWDMHIFPCWQYKDVYFYY